MRLFSFYIFRCLIILFRFIPFPLLYVLSDFLRFILKNILRYRVSVIQKNIDYCFPDHSEEYKEDCYQQFYKQFVDILLESIKGLSTPEAVLAKRYKLKNPELLQDYYEDQKPIAIYTCHYNNWEWGPLTMGRQMDHHIVGVVKELTNKHINRFIIDGRSKNNVTVIPTYKTAEYLSQDFNKPPTKCLIFISDQRPSDQSKGIEVSFFDKKIIFDHKSAEYIKSLDLPVYNANVHRLRRGHYEIELIPLANINGNSTTQEITNSYVSNLEELISLSPSSWLWTHKRFKDYITY